MCPRGRAHGSAGRGRGRRGSGRLELVVGRRRRRCACGPSTHPIVAARRSRPRDRPYEQTCTCGDHVTIWVIVRVRLPAAIASPCSGRMATSAWGGGGGDRVRVRVRVRAQRRWWQSAYGDTSTVLSSLALRTRGPPMNWRAPSAFQYLPRAAEGSVGERTGSCRVVRQ